MRVLVVAAPLLGHVLPLVPLAAALREAGLHTAAAEVRAEIAAMPADVADAVLGVAVR